jgi:hypothetical protein
MSLKENLKQLNDFFLPDQAWLVENRAYLLATIRKQQRQTEGEEKTKQEKWLKKFKRLLRLVSFYPRLVTVSLATIFLFIGSIGLASAAKNSIPGDTLYPVKLALEKTGLKLLPTPHLRTKVQLELAGERLAEAQKVVTISQVPERAAEALQEFKTQLKGTTKNLDFKNIAQTSPKEIGELSQILIQKTKEYKAELKKTEEQLRKNGTVKPLVVEAQKILNESSFKAVELMTASAQMGGVEKTKVINEIKEKIEEAEEAINQKEVELLNLPDLRLKKDNKKENRSGGLNLLPTPDSSLNSSKSNELTEESIKKESLEENPLEERNNLNQEKERQELENKMQIEEKNLEEQKVKEISLEKIKEARQILAEAKERLGEEDFQGALTKIKECLDLIE